jgi:hypothetical protein
VVTAAGARIRSSVAFEELRRSRRRVTIGDSDLIMPGDSGHQQKKRCASCGTTSLLLPQTSRTGGWQWRLVSAHCILEWILEWWAEKGDEVIVVGGSSLTDSTHESAWVSLPSAIIRVIDTLLEARFGSHNSTRACVIKLRCGDLQILTFPPAEPQNSYIFRFSIFIFLTFSYFSSPCP